MANKENSCFPLLTTDWLSNTDSCCFSFTGHSQTAVSFSLLATEQNRQLSVSLYWLLSNTGSCQFPVTSHRAKQTAGGLTLGESALQILFYITCTGYWAIQIAANFPLLVTEQYGSCQFPFTGYWAIQEAVSLSLLATEQYRQLSVSLYCYWAIQTAVNFPLLATE